MAFLGNGFTPHKINSGERDYQDKLRAAKAQHSNRNAFVSGIEYPQEAPSNFSQKDNQGSIFNTPLKDPLNQTGSVDLGGRRIIKKEMSAEENALQKMGQQHLDKRMAAGHMPNLNNHATVYGGRRRG